MDYHEVILSTVSFQAGVLLALRRCRDAGEKEDGSYWELGTRTFGDQKVGKVL